jgi:hypothetical protein
MTTTIQTPPSDDLAARAAHLRSALASLAPDDPRAATIHAGLAVLDRALAERAATATPPATNTSFTSSHAWTGAGSEIRRALGVLCEPGALYELRMLGVDGAGVRAGFFDDLDALAATAAEYDGRARGIYVTLNPVKPDLLEQHGHPRNTLTHTVKNVLTSEADVVHRRWCLLDFDPERPRGSATDEEKAAAYDRAESCRQWLVNAMHVAAESIVSADSGNGWHLLVRVDLPNDDESKTLVQQCLVALSVRFTDAAIKFDTTPFDANRITKLYGTMACKGANTAERPHRRSALEPSLASAWMQGGAGPTPVPRDALERIAATLPPDGDADAEQEAAFNIAAWIAERGLSVAFDGPWTGIGGKGRKWVLNPCPFNRDHDNRSAVILQHASGAISFRCHHDGCAGNDWRGLRDLLEPGWRERAAANTSTSGTRRPSRHLTDRLRLAPDGAASRLGWGGLG